MKRKKLLSFIFCVNNVLFYCCGGVEGLPTENLQNNIAVNKFQSALQQQSFFSILTSIEDRLRNLDSIYSMQLSQTLESKLDLYNRKLETLDSKIIRLEALVMLNLDKISENISTKNFKDDVTKTNTFRKIDSVYEGISHRLSYMDRKYETNFVKVQARMDTTLTRLERIEENMATRESDIEAELSDAIFAIDDLKTTYNTMEGKLLNITSSTFNISKDNYKFLSNMNMESKKSLNRFHDNIIENLQYIDNKTSVHYKTTEENNMMLKSMKTELKEDFNDYANKVADMNSYIWKNSDTTEDDLKMIAAVVNSTKIEVQNGVRSLMLQIGKLSNKENTIPVGSNFEDINKKLTTNFEKILTNQDLFLESCHRLQMDEAQIESEISVMLEKLIDMLEKKMASEMKDIKSLEKTLKNHDWKVNRNVYQVNSNVISLFEKSTIHNEELRGHIEKMTNDLNALFAFVQSTTPAGGSPSSTIINVKMIMEKLNKIENFVIGLNNRSHSGLNISNIQDNNAVQRMSNQMESNANLLNAIESQITKNLNEESFDKVFSTILPKYLNCTFRNDIKIKSTDETEIDDDTKKVIVDIFGPNTNLMKPQMKSPDDTSIKSKCKKNYRNFINIRADTDPNCDENINHNKRRGRKKKKKYSLIDVRSNFDSSGDVEYEDPEETTENTTELEIITDETVILDITTESTTANNNDDIVNSLVGIKPDEIN